MIKETKSGGDNIPRMKSKCITTVDDGHDALKEYFDNGRHVFCKNKANDEVDTFKTFKHLTCDNLIRRCEETLIGLKKINSCYQFVVTNIGIVHSRMRSCA